MHDARRREMMKKSGSDGFSASISPRRHSMDAVSTAKGKAFQSLDFYG